MLIYLLKVFLLIHSFSEQPLFFFELKVIQELSHAYMDRKRRFSYKNKNKEYIQIF